jgi:hypothetical protein
MSRVGVAKGRKMGPSPKEILVYLEVGSKRTFAGATDWPGWCRSGRDESAALGALFDYAPRYARVLRAARVGFQPPANASALVVTERLDGDATTDFGAPGIAPSSDARPIDDAELARLQAVLKACWRAFDSAGLAARGKELRKGARGGGRELESIVEHVLGADSAYLGRLAWKFKRVEEGEASEELRRIRGDILKAFTAAAAGDLPSKGPRGGALWKPRYFVRRVSWHVLDHAWEIEDRTT